MAIIDEGAHSTYIRGLLSLSTCFLSFFKILNLKVDSENWFDFDSPKQNVEGFLATFLAHLTQIVVFFLFLISWLMI